jgi:hypothetical protein
MFMAALYRAASERNWPLRRSALAFVSSITPFGTFFFDRSLRREINEMNRDSLAPISLPAKPN